MSSPQRKPDSGRNSEGALEPPAKQAKQGWYAGLAECRMGEKVLPLRTNPLQTTHRNGPEPFKAILIYSYSNSH